MLGTFVTGTLVSGATPAHADEIKTLDLSLPSYDKVNTLKADQQALGVEDLPEPKSKGPPAKKKASAGSGGGNSPLGSVLPSMNKSGPSKKPKAPKEEKPKKAKPEPQPKQEYETMDLGLPSYSDNTATRGKSAFSIK